MEDFYLFTVIVIGNIYRNIAPMLNVYIFFLFHCNFTFLHNKIIVFSNIASHSPTEIHSIKLF